MCSRQAVVATSRRFIAYETEKEKSSDAFGLLAELPEVSEGEKALDSGGTTKAKEAFLRAYEIASSVFGDKSEAASEAGRR